ncbi:hypothetical protein A19Y_4488 [Planktothrix agardhii NIVA-CYA 126/8]|uniref:Uncharacterized protein n=2 Tax=Planktothrix agardhii TaxID=1160 RepID=A0A073CMH7_PLAA1|nr:hypothetical protein A19Y_4488 [Planktothrix agardhii NIVA-CYA 126/8]
MLNVKPMINPLTISPEIATGIETVAQQFDLSVTELLERISQGKLTVINPEELEDFLDLKDGIQAENDPENQERVSWDVIKHNLGIN